MIFINYLNLLKEFKLVNDENEIEETPNFPSIYHPYCRTFTKIFKKGFVFQYSQDDKKSS